jgi:hypothetical protein
MDEVRLPQMGAQPGRMKYSPEYVLQLKADIERAKTDPEIRQADPEGRFAAALQRHLNRIQPDGTLSLIL